MGGCITPPAKKQKTNKPDLTPKKSTLISDANNPLDTTLPDMANQK